MGWIWFGKRHGESLAKNESYEHLWQMLETLWRNTEARKNTESEDTKEIETLFRERPRGNPGDSGWTMANQAEQRIGRLLDATQLYTQFIELLDLARDRKIARLKAHEDRAKELFAKPPVENITPQIAVINRDAYLNLLSDLQEDFINRRLARFLGRRVAQRLVWVALVILLLVLSPLIYESILNSWSSASNLSFARFSNSQFFGFFMALSFGVLGAFFSRLTRFQLAAGSVSFEEFNSNYVGRIVLVRIMTGLFGALIFYVLMRSGLIDGDAFPNLDNTKIEPLQMDFSSFEKINMDETIKNEFLASIRASFGVTAPNKDLAKLLVWSFLAGFSERLVPDTLIHTENRIRDHQR